MTIFTKKFHFFIAIILSWEQKSSFLMLFVASSVFCVMIIGNLLYYIKNWIIRIFSCFVSNSNFTNFLKILWSTLYKVLEQFVWSTSTWTWLSNALWRNWVKQIWYCGMVPLSMSWLMQNNSCTVYGSFWTHAVLHIFNYVF